MHPKYLWRCHPSTFTTVWTVDSKVPTNNALVGSVVSYETPGRVHFYLTQYHQQGIPFNVGTDPSSPCRIAFPGTRCIHTGSVRQGSRFQHQDSLSLLPTNREPRKMKLDQQYGTCTQRVISRLYLPYLLVYPEPEGSLIRKTQSGASQSPLSTANKPPSPRSGIQERKIYVSHCRAMSYQSTHVPPGS